MILDIDFKPITERLAIEQGDGSQYAAHVAEIIDEIINSFAMSLDKVREENPDNEEILRIEAAKVIDQWLKTMREDVNKRNQSVFWAKNLLVLLVKTLDDVKSYDPYFGIIYNQFKNKLPKRYNIENKC
ncbi:hypothetical protein J2Z44_003515 [Clostridium punense]|uniref:Uncharacterized protein n=1 Tax=Clostridium punense TaxID=1054297 RepID=A0ABS4K7B6_9CLOT|nr:MULTISPECIES: hypothetical protein [Clostridium]EQB87242.1 hypothetical protein M918_10325 [Clostridium sp. BL8]MBP2023673.1 hypothetical protein [Clostridium punense]